MSQLSGIFSQEAMNFLTDFDEFSSLIAKNQNFSTTSSDNNVEVTAQHVIVPNEIFYNMINSNANGQLLNLDNLNSDAFIRFSHQQEPQQQQTYPNQLTKASSLLSNTVFSGDYNFEIEFNSDILKSKTTTWTFSKELNKLYSKMAIQCPMRVKVFSEPPPGSIIRLAAVYKKEEHKNEQIRRCANHTNSKEFNEKPHISPNHFIRVANLNTIYSNDKNMTTTVPYESPQVASPSTIYLVQFMCYNSCIGGGKKPIEIIVTLEKDEKVFARQQFDVKICAMPNRDREFEECKEVGESSKQPSSKVKQSENKNSIKNTSETIEINMIKKSPVTSPKLEVFNLEVIGSGNYEILKDLRNALYAKDGIEVDDNKIKAKLLSQPTIIYNNDSNKFQPESNVHLKPTVLNRNDTIEKFLSELDLINYFDSFRSAGYNTIEDILECQPDKINELNIAEGPTQKIWNEILNIKASETANGSQESDSQNSLKNKKSNSIEITKISMKYPINSKVENNNIVDANRQSQHQMMTRKRTTDLNDTEHKKNSKRKR